MQLSNNPPNIKVKCPSETDALPSICEGRQGINVSNTSVFLHNTTSSLWLEYDIHCIPLFQLFGQIDAPRQMY